MPEHTEESAQARLTELLTFEDGWLDGDGKKPTEAAVATARVFLKTSRTWSAWSIFPTEEGGVSLEAMDLGAKTVTSIHFAPEGTEGDVFVFDHSQRLRK